uniref:Evolutionarily conserved signaling intermediate in Toll pathway, mitochondrial n=1 Tax=Glossina morsitans morsitans TaxID=37546 RepID=D3TPK5_GLOMM
MIRKLKGLLNNSNNSFASCIITWKTYSNEANRKKEESEGENSESDSFQQQRKKQNSEEQQKTTSTSFVPAIRNPFAEASEKTKGVYMSMVEIFTERDIRRRNHVEFIYAAMKHMAEFGVERDLEVYKALINVLPKGKFIPRNIFQAEFMHYPKQQQCIIDLLEQMEDLGVMPDYEMEAMLLNVFGRSGHPLRKYWRMMYWMPKFKNRSPWPLPNPVPDSALTMAKLAIERMCTVDVRSRISVFETKNVVDAIDDTWIVSGMSPDQTQLLHKHPYNKAIYIEGPFLIWLRSRTINYFTLRADPDVEFLNSLNSNTEDEDDVTKLRVPFFGQPPISTKNQVGKVRSVHQQDDGTIFAICATGTSTKDSLLSWIRLLEANGNPVLSQIPVLFRFRSKISDKVKEIEPSSEIKASTATNNELSTDDPKR